MSYVNAHYLVETGWLADHLDDPQLRIVDCHVDMIAGPDGMAFVPARNAWRKAHIPGADFIDFKHELSDPGSSFRHMLPPPGQFAEVMGRHGIGNGPGDETRVVVYDHGSSAWASRLWWMLRGYGFENAAVLNGGLSKWIRESRPLSQAAPEHPAAHFIPDPKNQTVFVGKEEVRACMEDAGT